MPGRLEFERAIRRSTLPPPSRHLALTLATWADMNTGIIPEPFMPSQNTLLKATGMGKPTLRKYMAVLTLLGWIVADAPTPHAARTQHARTQYALVIPAAAAEVGEDEELGQGVTQAGSPCYPAPEEAGSASYPALGQGVTQAGSTGDPGLGNTVTPRVPKSLKSHQSPAGGGAIGPRPLSAAEERTGSDRKIQKPNTPNQMPLLLSVQRPAQTSAPSHKLLAEQMSEFYGLQVTVRHAAATSLAVLDGGRATQNPLAYVMAAVRRDPNRHRPTSLPAPYRAPRRAAGDA